MANTPISGLNPGAAVKNTDLLPDVQTVGVGPVKVTAQQIKDFTSDSPTLITPDIGVAKGKSLSLNTSGSYFTTIESSGSATQSWNFILPPDDGTSGYILSTDGSGNTTWVNPAVIGIDIDVNTTAIVGGTSGHLVYDNAGTFGEMSAITTDGASTLTLGIQQTTQGLFVLANTAAGSFSTTIKSSNSSTESWSLTLPVSKGSNGYVLTTDGTGISSWTNPTALGIDINVNSTAITGGTTGRVVYDNAGTFGEISAITTNGSDTLTVGTQQTTQGNVVLSNTSAGAFPVTVKSSNSTSSAWSLTLPTTAGTNKYALTTDGTGVSSWSQIDLADAVTGTLPVNHGGTGQSTLAQHGVVIGNAASGVNVTSTGSSGQVFQSGGAAADPVWSTATYPSTATGTGTILRADGTNWVATVTSYPTTTTINQLLYSDSNNNVTGLTTGNGGVLNTNSTGVPSITANPTLGVQQTTQGSLILANTAAGAFSTTLKSSNSASEAWTLILPVSKGTNGYILTTDGTGASAWTNPTALGIDIDVNSTAITSGTSGRLVYDNAGTFGEISAITTNGSDTLTVGVQQTTQGSIVLANAAVGAFSTTVKSSNSASASWTLTLPTTAGTNNYVLTTNGSGTSSWSQVSLTAGVTGTLPVGNGGTGQTTNTAHGVLIGNAGNAINSTTAGSNGQVLQSSGASSDPTWTTATFPSTATSTGTILRADGTNWSATTATYPTTTSAGTVLISGSANAVTASATPTLGVAGTTVGTVAFANATSGSITLSPTTGALGSSTITMPATTGTMTVLGNSTTGSGNIVLATSPSLTTPALGVATATSLAIGGATIGTDGLAVTGTATLSGSIYEAAGSGAAPSYAFSTDTASGMFSPAAGALGLASNGSERARFDSAGNLAVGSTTTAGVNLLISKNNTGSAFGRGIQVQPQVQSGVTSNYYGFSSYPSVVDASFTLPALIHFVAVQNTKGASATITNQYGFYADSSLSGAGTNYGYYSNLSASAATRYNFYANGTAPNLFNGSTIIGKAALATTATDGFLYIPTCAGAPTGVPTTQTGTVAMIYDTTNNNFYIYNGAWKKVALT